MDKKRIIKTFTGMTIYPYKRKQCNLLEKLTSISRYPKKGRIPYNGFFVKPKMFACRLFTLDFLYSLFPDYEIISATPYKEDIIYPFAFHDNIEFSDVQKSFCGQMMKLHNNRIFCNLQTGYGKTFIMIYMISQIQRKTIVLCYKTDVLKQWVNSLNNHTTFDKNRSMIITSSQTLYNIENGDLDVSNIDIFLCTPTLIGSFADKYGWPKISSLFEKMHIGVKIYDEAHRNIKILTLLDAFTNVKRNFYLSADYSQSNPEKTKLFFQTFFDAQVVSVNSDVEKSMRYINALVVYFNSNPSELDQMSICNPNFGFNNFEYMKYEFSKEKLLQTLVVVLNTIVKSNYDGKRILIVTSMIEHVLAVHDYIKNLYPTYKPSPLYSELSDYEKEFALGQSDMIIATAGSFGPGIDVKGIKYVIALDQFDIITDNQLSGRARPDTNGINNEAFYIMLSDTGFDYCNKKIGRRIGYLAKHKLNKITYVKT